MSFSTEQSSSREMMILFLLLVSVTISSCAVKGSSSGKLDKTLAKQFSVAVLDQAQKAPDFTLSSLKGESISLSDYRGKIVLLNFSTSW